MMDYIGSYVPNTARNELLINEKLPLRRCRPAPETKKLPAGRSLVPRSLLAFSLAPSSPPLPYALPTPQSCRPPPGAPRGTTCRRMQARSLSAAAPTAAPCMAASFWWTDRIPLLLSTLWRGRWRRAASFWIEAATRGEAPASNYGVFAQAFDRT